MARLISGLALLRAEFDEINPHRDRRSDGWIGDNHHKLRVSDHNPDPAGVVHALDVDVNGVPMARVVAYLVTRCRSGRERRLKYIIYRRVIWSASWGWTARRYTGSNPHIAHAHFSAAAGAELSRGAGAWGIAAAARDASRTATAVATHDSSADGRDASRVDQPLQARRLGSRELSVRPKPLTGSDVEYVQDWIGDRCGPPDGRYGPKTAAGVRWYQRMRGITVDGKVGPQTWRQMGVRWTGST